MSDTEFQQEIARLQFQVATLEQLLQVQERTTVEQAEGAERAMAALQEAKVQNEFQVAALEQLLEVHEATVFATSQVEEARSHALLNAIPDMMFRLDKDGVLADFKAQSEAQLAQPPEAFLGKKITDVMPLEVGRLTMDNARRVLATGQLATFEYQLPVGETLGTYEARMVPAGGQEVLVIVRDVTERKRLERQIQDSLTRRGYQVQTSTEVAQEIAAAPALEELYRRVVTLIKERFGYYHAQIFRYEPALNAVLLVIGYGEAGAKMLAAGHRLAMGRGVVGTAAATGQPVLATDVTQEEGWRPNPNLPATKGELAVPIKLRDEVLGILDVQSDQVGALTQDDQLLLEGLCGQIAVAAESTRLRQEMEERLRELNTMYRATAREGWQAMHETAALPKGYLFDRTDIRLAEDLWLPEMERAVEQNALVAPGGETGRNSAAVAPLSVRGEIIGALGVYDDPQQPMSQDDLDLVQSVSEQVALALESARLFVQTRTALSQTQQLYEINRDLSAVASEQDLLRVLAQSIQNTGVDSASLVYLDLDEAGRPAWIEVAADWQREGAPSTPIGARFSIHDLPSASLWLTNRTEPTFMADVNTDARATASLRGMLARVNAQAFASIPLIQAGRWVGVITFNWQAPHEFTLQEAALYQAFIGMVSPVVESQRLLKQTQARARREQTLREVTARLRGSTDPDAVMRALARELGTVLGRSTFVRLVTPEEGKAEELTQAAVPQMTGGEGQDAAS